jgi:hypothetical protein
MTPPQKIKSDDYRNVQVKSEKNLTVSKKDQYKFLLENIDNSSVEKIEVSLYFFAHKISFFL